jgi:hypothetical protein
MDNIFLLILFLIIIYLIDRQILKPKMILFYIIIVLIWKFSTLDRENFNQYLYLGKNPNSNSFKRYLYDNTAKVYTSNDYYNNSNCTLENGEKSCIIPPNNINLFPPDLKKIASKNSNYYQCNKGLIKYPQCKKYSISPVTENFSVITPDIPDGTLMEGGNQKCSVGNEFPIGPGLQSKPPKGCCPQGYSFDERVQKCKQVCRGCKTGVCEKSGWCFSNTCGNNNVNMKTEGCARPKGWC